jgi:ribonuclease HII
MRDWQEIEVYASENQLHVIGVDEAGRGPLCGPVMAGAVLLSTPNLIEGLACSKTLTPKRRTQLLQEIQQHARGFAVAEASVDEIDQLNILQASLLAMTRAVQCLIESLNLNEAQCLVLVDGNKLPAWSYPSIALVKGDSQVPAISAASILAKVSRDRWCANYARVYPQYEIDVHMGYPTPRHMLLLKQYGASPIHRKTFRPVREVLAAAQGRFFS